MNVKQAVGLAKQHIADLFAGESVTNIGLEEVEYDEPSNLWHVTIGFSRPWDSPVFATMPMARSYKVVNIADDGRVLSVKNRETANA